MAKVGIGPQPNDKGTLSIHQDGKCLVNLKADGTVEFGEGYKPEAAAEVFWKAIAKNYSRVWGRAWLIVKALSELPEKHPTAEFPDCTIRLIMEAERVVQDAPKRIVKS